MSIAMQHPLQPIEARETGLHEGIISGYASRFNQIDQSGDEVAPFAFSHSLKLRGNTGIRMLFQHNPDQPVGVWKTLREDAEGLFVEGKIICTCRQGADLFQLVKSGAVDGLSIGFKTRRAFKNPKTKVRRILEADLWEISLVTFPLLPSARIESVKSIHSTGFHRSREPGVIMAERLRTAISNLETRIKS